MDHAIDINKTIETMAKQITSLNLQHPTLIGIHTGGVWIAERLYQIMDSDDPMNDPLGALDISFYRDDFSRVGLNPEVKSSTLPSAIEDRNIVLVDDVLYTGRTIRAALNEIFSYGRPTSVILAVLLDRSGRELPIQADITGCEITLKQNQQVKLSNRNGQLELNIVELGNTE